MNAKNNKRSARVTSKKVTISNQAKGLTSQAGLVPVVKFLRNCRMIGLIQETLDHERGAKCSGARIKVASNLLFGAISCYSLNEWKMSARNSISPANLPWRRPYN